MGIIVKGASAIERLGRARAVLLDKTGTVTIGAPAVENIVALDGLSEPEVLRLAASVDQLSSHTVAEALVHAAQDRGLELELPVDVSEGSGQGIEGSIGGRRVAVGSAAWLVARGYEDTTRSWAGRGLGRTAGGPRPGRRRGPPCRRDRDRRPAAPRRDRARAGAPRRGDPSHCAGDRRPRRESARLSARSSASTAVYADQSPADKLELVRVLKVAAGRRAGRDGR